MSSGILQSPLQKPLVEARVFVGPAVDIRFLRRAAVISGQVLSGQANEDAKKASSGEAASKSRKRLGVLEADLVWQGRV